MHEGVEDGEQQGTEHHVVLDDEAEVPTPSEAEEEIDLSPEPEVEPKPEDVGDQSNVAESKEDAEARLRDAREDFEKTQAEWIPHPPREYYGEAFTEKQMSGFSDRKAKEILQDRAIKGNTWGPWVTAEAKQLKTETEGAEGNISADIIYTVKLPGRTKRAVTRLKLIMTPQQAVDGALKLLDAAKEMHDSATTWFSAMAKARLEMQGKPARKARKPRKAAAKAKPAVADEKAVKAPRKARKKKASKQEPALAAPARKARGKKAAKPLSQKEKKVLGEKGSELLSGLLSPFKSIQKGAKKKRKAKKQ